MEDVWASREKSDKVNAELKVKVLTIRGAGQEQIHDNEVIYRRPRECRQEDLCGMRGDEGRLWLGGVLWVEREPGACATCP
eukprot:2927347-Heterocapsa_arctica.AAC.1